MVQKVMIKNFVEIRINYTATKTFFLFKDALFFNKPIFSSKTRIVLLQKHFSFPTTYHSLQQRKHCSFAQTCHTATKPSLLSQRQSYCSENTVKYRQRKSATCKTGLQKFKVMGKQRGVVPSRVKLRPTYKQFALFYSKPKLATSEYPRTFRSCFARSTI